MPARGSISRLRVHDEGGNEGQAILQNFVLPGKVFKNPLALALAEQRRILALDAGSGTRCSRRSTP